MARRNPRREALLEQVAKRQRAAGQKVSRLERREQPIRVRKAGLDPRRPMESVRQMSTPELHRYLARLERFNSRSTAFVAGQHGQPLDAGLWRQLGRVQKRVNAQAEAHDAAVAGIVLPTSTGAVPQTIAERRATLTERGFPAAGGQVRTFQAITRESASGIPSNAAMRKLIKAAERKLEPGYLDRAMRQQRKTLKKMLTEAGDSDVWNEVKELSNQQLQVLIDETPFMSHVGYRYEEKQVRDGRPGDTDTDNIFNTAGNKLRQLAKWAPSIGTENPSGTVRSDHTEPGAGALPAPTRNVYTEKSPAGPISTQPDAHRIGDAVTPRSGNTIWHIAAVASEGNPNLIPKGHLYIERGSGESYVGKWVSPRGYLNLDRGNRKRKRDS